MRLAHSSSFRSRQGNSQVPCRGRASLNYPTVTFPQRVEVVFVQHSLQTKIATSRSQSFRPFTNLEDSHYESLDGLRPPTSEINQSPIESCSTEPETCSCDWRRSEEYITAAHCCRVRTLKMAAGLDRRKYNLSTISSIWMFLFLLVAPAAHAAKTAADYYIKSLPGAPDGPLLKMHAG